MDGERKFVVVAITFGMFCITVLYVFLFVSLWQYKEFVGLSLLVILILLAVVYMLGKLNEQRLRQVRYDFNREIPIDPRGEVHYRPGWAQENPHHVPSHVSSRTSSRRSASQPHEWAEGYPQQSRY